jgi:hypothetical protein
VTPRSLIGALVAVLLVGAVVVVGVLRATPQPSPSPPTSPSPSSSPASSPASSAAFALREDAATVYGRFATLGQATAGGEAGALSASRAGVLALPTGRVVAADVYVVDAVPFVRQVQPGRYEVTALHLDLGPLDDRIAAAMVRFAPGDPVQWEMAVTPGQDASQLRGNGGIFGYSVDSGTGCFTSAEAVDALGTADPVASTAYARLVETAMFPKPNEIRSTAEIAVPGTDGLDVVAFESGFGDGAYASYFGLDARGMPVVLLTSFGILDPPPG